MEQKEFVITAAGGLADVSDLMVTGETLNNNIKLADFGKGVRNISFCALTYREPNEIHNPFWNYNPESRTIEGSWALDFQKASSYIGQEAQRLVCEALFELFDKVAGEVEDFDFAALKKAMLNAVATNPALAEKTRFRVYSDTGMVTGDIPEFASFMDLSKYGDGAQKLFFEASLFNKPQSFLPNPPMFDAGKRGLYISVVSSLDVNSFASGLDRAVETLKPLVQNFDFDLFKADILRFVESLTEMA